MTDEFRVMQPISIGVERSDDRVAYFPSLILDFTRGKRLMVGVPQDQGMEVRLRPGTAVTMDVSLPSGIMRYRTCVRGRTEAPLALEIDWPGHGERIQRREHFRVQIQVPVEGTIRRPGDIQPFRSTSLDLSAGGVRLRLAEALPPGTQLEMRLLLPGSGARPPECIGRVVRSGTIEAATSAERYWNGVEFAQMEEAARKEVVRFVFEVQREQLRKGVS